MLLHASGPFTGADLTTHDGYAAIFTRTHGGGYVIMGVDLKFTGPANSAADWPSVALLDTLGTTEAVLTGSPTDLGDYAYAFTPNTPIRIGNPGRIYLLIEGGTLTLARTTGFQSDDIRVAGWLLLPGQSRPHNSTGSFTNISGRYMLRVRGRVVQPGTPCVSNTEQASTASQALTNNERAQTFTAGSNSAGYPL